MFPTSLTANGNSRFLYIAHNATPEPPAQTTAKIKPNGVDEAPNTAAQYGIRSIPTMFLFKDGKQVDTKVGLNSKDNLISWINSHA